MLFSSRCLISELKQKPSCDTCLQKCNMLKVYFYSHTYLRSLREVENMNVNYSSEMYT
jgi:hypothetical protein